MPFLTRAGCRLFYAEAGDPAGAPLVLVRGLGRSSRYWSPLLPELAAFRIVMLDNRGVGQSDAPRPPYTVRGLADDVASVMDAARIDRAHLFGMSLGGMIAQHVALAHADRVDRLVLGCTSPGRLGTPPALRSQLALARATLDPFDRVGRQLALLVSAATLAAHPELRDAWRAIARDERISLRGLAGQVAAVLRHDTLARLADIAHPTLVITGDDDAVIPPCNSDVLAARIPGARLVVLPGARHDFTTDRPAETGRALREFLTVGPSPAAERRA